MTAGIYVIRNRVNGKEYIGQSIDIEDRWQAHRYELRKGTHHNGALQGAWRKYGEDALLFVILEAIDDPSVLNERERYHGETRKPAYNRAPLGLAHDAVTFLATQERIRLAVLTLRAEERPFTTSDVAVLAGCDRRGIYKWLHGAPWWSEDDTCMSRKEGQRRGQIAIARDGFPNVQASLKKMRAAGFPNLKRAQEIAKETGYAGARAFQAKRRGTHVPDTHGNRMKGEKTRHQILTLLRVWYEQDNESGQIYGYRRLADALQLRPGNVLHHLRILKTEGRIDEYNRPITADNDRFPTEPLVLPQFARSAEIRKRILLESAIWCDQHPGKRLGCTTLARLVGATDQAVWKHLRKLRAEGRVDGLNRPIGAPCELTQLTLF